MNQKYGRIINICGKTRAQRIRSYGVEAAILTVLYTGIDVLGEMLGFGAVLRLTVFMDSRMDFVLSVAAGFAVTFLVLYIMDYSIYENILKRNRRKGETTNTTNQ